MLFITGSAQHLSSVSREGEEERVTHVLEEPPVYGEALGGQGLGDVVEGEQRAVLLQAVLPLHRLQQDGDELGPLAWAVQPRHLGNQHRNLGGDLRT